MTPAEHTKDHLDDFVTRLIKWWFLTEDDDGNPVYDEAKPIGGADTVDVIGQLIRDYQLEPPGLINSELNNKDLEGEI